MITDEERHERAEDFRDMVSARNYGIPGRSVPSSTSTICFQSCWAAESMTARRPLMPVRRFSPQT